MTELERRTLTWIFQVQSILLAAAIDPSYVRNLNRTLGGPLPGLQKEAQELAKLWQEQPGEPASHSDPDGL